MMDDRGKMTEENFISKLKKDYNYHTYPENAMAIADVFDSSLYSGNWDPSMASGLIEPVFNVGTREYSQKDLAAFIAGSKRFSKKDSYSDILNRKLNEMSRLELMNQEKDQLESKYPAFRYLMEEYHDGILLFNIMDSKVWGKAVNDSNALRDFYNQHKADYNWKERADVSIYTINDPAAVKTVTKLARKRIKTRISPDAFRKTACPSDTIACVAISDEKYESGEKLPLGGFEWKKGAVKMIPEGNVTKLLVVNAILPPAPRLFNETQGQVTADYQNFLDKQWINELRAKYKVQVNQDVLKMVK
jgi:peptidyl-prolyl cis-trans isomerase SurA